MGNAHISPAQQYSPLGEALVDLEKGPPEPPLSAPEERKTEQLAYLKAVGQEEARPGAGLAQCPKCGQPSLVRQEGCDICTSCGYSRCG